MISISPRLTQGEKMQTATVITKTANIYLELPPKGVEILPGVKWGAVDAFPTPAYWVYQVFANRVQGTSPNYRLGRTLAEEVGACLLGGHGIPASVGLAAYEHVKTHRAFDGEAPTEQQLVGWLQEPLNVHGRAVRYRFAAQKARYLAAALRVIPDAPSNCSGKTLRDWLLQVPGIGHKTASWIARNWLAADDVAILDIHILRFGQAINLFPTKLTVERHYEALEALFLAFSAKVGIRPSDLDAVIWLEMATSPLSTRTLVSAGNSALHRTNKRHSDTIQIAASA